MLGKRKRKVTVASRTVRSVSPDSSTGEIEKSDVSAIFKSYFEGQFAPLENGSVARKPEARRIEEEDDVENTDSDSEWSGISGDEINEVEVVSHVGPVHRDEDQMAKLELKAFMSSRPPPSSITSTTKAKPKHLDDDEDPNTEAANLANDLALQRLLRESHLLSANFTPQLSHSGSSRHKAIDLRLQSLGSKDSIFKQQKMPMSHRKGIVNKGILREDKRRKEAKENGIILERKGGKERRRAGKRDIDVDGPSVGRWKEGTLKLSGKDVRDIQGPKERLMKGRKKGRR